MSGISTTINKGSFFAIVGVNTHSGIPPLKVDFTSIVIGGKAPYTYTWDFGDGSPKTDEEAPIHVYNHIGVYQVVLTVEDANQIKTSYTQYIQVLDNEWAMILGARFIRVLKPAEEFVKLGVGNYGIDNKFTYTKIIDIKNSIISTIKIQTESVNFDNSSS